MLAAGAAAGQRCTADEASVIWMGMNLKDTTFRALANSANGSLNTETEMHFTSDDGIVVGHYGGGTIVTGHVLAMHRGETELEMLYQGVTANGEIQAGRARAELAVGDDAGVRMHLDWQWLTGDRSSGQSEWVKV